MSHPGWSGVAGGLTATATNCAVGQDDLTIDLVGGDVESESVCAAQGSGPVSLTPGQSAIIYFQLTNGTLTSLDSGIPATIGIFAGKAGGPQSISVIGRS